jgi:hypothetical protein
MPQALHEQGVRLATACGLRAAVDSNICRASKKILLRPWLWFNCRHGITPPLHIHNYIK